MRFRVTIGERQHTSAVMMGRREVKELGIGSPWQQQDEGGGAQILRSHILKRENVRRRWYVGRLPKRWISRRHVPVHGTGWPQIHVQRITPHLGDRPAPAHHVGGGIRRTFIDLLRRQIARERGVLRVQQEHLIRKRRNKIVIVSQNPEGVSLATSRQLRAVGHQTVIVVRAVQHPGQRQLPLVVQTLDPMRLHLGLRQRREQKGGENRDDRDYYQ